MDLMHTPGRTQQRKVQTNQAWTRPQQRIDTFGGRDNATWNACLKNNKLVVIQVINSLGMGSACESFAPMGQQDRCSFEIRLLVLWQDKQRYSKRLSPRVDFSICEDLCRKKRVLGQRYVICPRSSYLDLIP